MTTTIQPTSGRASTSPGSRRSRSDERARVTRELFCLARSSESEQERRKLLERVIELHLDLAHGLAARYRARGVPLEDLRQVAAMALTKATQGYEVSSGHEFLSYAVPTIRGELRKYFRDHGWMVRPPRRIQELQAEINLAETELTHQLRRSPRPAEVAEHLDEPVDAVIEALASDGCFSPVSLDHPLSTEDDATLGDALPEEDHDWDAAEARTIVHPLLRQLPDRDRQILSMRFFQGLTQREIADHLGVTQMQVSRLLTRILAQLRSTVGDVPLR
jgi:RNA polymerase sigma-B factor